MTDRYHTPGWGTITFLTGLVVGGITALIVATDDQGETKPEVKKRIALGKARAKAEMENVRVMVNEKWDSLSEAYLQARRALEEKLTTLKQNAAAIDKTRYLAAVNEVVAEMKKSSSTTSEQLGHIKTFLIEDYSKLAAEPKKRESKKKNNQMKG